MVDIRRPDLAGLQQRLSVSPQAAVQVMDEAQAQQAGLMNRPPPGMQGAPGPQGPSPRPQQGPPQPPGAQGPPQPNPVQGFQMPQPPPQMPGPPGMPMPPAPESVESRIARIQADAYANRMAGQRLNPIGAKRVNSSLADAYQRPAKEAFRIEKQMQEYQAKMQQYMLDQRVPALMSFGWTKDEALRIAQALPADADLSKYADRDKIQVEIDQREQALAANPSLGDGLTEDQRDQFRLTGNITRNDRSQIIEPLRPPTDHYFNNPLDPSQGVTLIPNSPTDYNRKQEAAQAQLGVRNAWLEAENAMEQAEEAMGNVGFLTTGIVGTILRQIPGTDAAELASQLRTQQANVAFKRLENMRNASVTGGALGNVSNQEIRLLYESWDQLDPNLDDEPLLRSLENLQRRWDRTRFALMNNERWKKEGLSASEQLRQIDAYEDNRKVMGRLIGEVGADAADRLMYELSLDPSPEAAQEFREATGMDPILVNGNLYYDAQQTY